MALIEFYIRNYTLNGVVNTSETLFQTVPMTNLEQAILNPKVKGEMGKAGSFDFGMELGHPLYDAMMQMKTQIRVDYAGRTIFNGRVLTIDKGLQRTRNVHCEGRFAALIDSNQEGTKEDTRPTISVLAYLQQLINKHNSDVEAEKQFVLGEVPGQYSASIATEQRVKIPDEKANQQFGSSSWNTTMDRIEDLLDNFGGYFRVRYSGNTAYLDWLDKYYDANINGQPIEIAKNLIDLSGTTEVDNLFTIVIPIGKKDSENVYIGDYWPVIKSGHAGVNYITVPELTGLYSDSELNVDYHRKSDYADAINRYGKIWKTVDFENANTPEKLFNYAKDWMKNNYMPELTQWSVTALDLRTTDGSIQPLYVGDREQVYHPEVDQSFGSMTVIAAEYDLYNMEKTKYTIGIPNQIINAAYGVKQKNESSGKSGGGSAGGGISSTTPPPTDGDDTLAQLKNRLQYEYSLKTDWGQDITLDDPLAMFVYNTRGEKLSAKESFEKVKQYTSEFNQAFTRYDNPLTLATDAAKAGLDPNDSKTKAKLAMQWMEDHNPKLAKENAKWKADTEYFIVNDLGMTMQEANVLLNERTGSSWLASLVDDDGEFTQSAYDKGAAIWKDKDSIKKMAVNTRNILNGNDNLPGTEVINGIRQYIVGDSLNLGNFLNFDGDDLTFDLGSLFNLDGIKNIFKLISNSLQLDGENGTGLFGWNNDRWNIGINTPITYTDIDGKERTVGGDGQITAQDFNIPEIPSFKTKFAYIDEVVATKATIAELRAYEALLGGGTPKVNEDGSVTFEGTALQTNAEHILGVNGKFDIDKETGTLKIIEGGGMKILRNGVEYGVYDNGSLTGGIIVDKVNDGTVTTKIKGNRIVVGNDLSADDLSTWAKNAEGLIAEKATIKQLNATNARVTTLETDYLKVDDLHAKIANMSEMNAQKITCASLHSERGGVSVASVSCNSLTLGGTSFPYTSAIIGASVSGNVLTLTPFVGKPITFSKATTLKGSWSGGTFKVTASPQDVSVETTLTSIKSNGNPSISAVNALDFAFPLKVQYTTGNGVADTGFTTTYVANLGTLLKTVEVTPIGAKQVITPVSATILKLSSGTRYTAGTEVTRYKGNGSSVTGRGDKVSIQAIGNAVHFKRHTSGTPSGTWYTIESSGYNLTYYLAKSAADYYKGNGSSVTGRGDSEKITPVGTSSTCYYIDLTNGTNYYKPGEQVTLYKAGTKGTYYQKK